MVKAKGKRNRRKEKLEFVQDFLPIRDLKNGIIETTDNRYIKILEIEPINFTLRSDEEQFNIISSFASWLKISPMRLQFKSITRRADSDKHISMICEELEHEENPQCKELGEDYIGLIKDVGNREALTRRFFLIFQYEAVGRNESDDYAKIYGMLQTAEQTARAYFMQCGNSIVQSKDPDDCRNPIHVLQPALLHGRAVFLPCRSHRGGHHGGKEENHRHGPGAAYPYGQLSGAPRHRPEPL